MLRTTIAMGKYVFDLPRYRKERRQFLGGLMVKGMIHWVRAATHAVDDTFPVQTGMAKGAFSNLVEWIEANKQDFGVNMPLGFSIKPKTYSVPNKNPNTGKSMSAKNNFMTIFSNQYGPHTIRFNWWTEVPHFIFNEDNEADPKLNLKHKTPWLAIQAGDLAMEEYLNKRLDTMPHLEEYIIWEEE